ncbi:MAG TPA: cytochrome P450 [Thermoleophilaceae bacterium]|nr:cytochrome P450 [Thermoleophilaceae bacterium]
MGITAPPPVSESPLVRIAGDLWTELAALGAYPPGPAGLSARRTHRMAHDPLPILLDCYERYGPVFSMRVLHGRMVFMLGPEANHYMLVSHAHNFRWRESSFGDLIPLLGDGLLTIDGDYHRRARRIMLPAFHHERIAASVETMVHETCGALERWRIGEPVDVHRWARELAMRIAMRALLGLDPADAGNGERAARHFARALAFYGTEYPLRIPRGPGSPWRRMQASRRVLHEIVQAEIARRRERPDPERSDVLSLLLEARDADGSGLTDQELRDQVMTLMFAGHDTSTSTVSFLLYELARHPHALDRVLAEQDRVLGSRSPSASDLAGGLPELDMALDEVLRLYPPAWVGPRRAVEAFHFAGRRVPAGAHVNYCSWASHRLPDVFPEPEAFIPERFAPERKRLLPKGAYVPFGGGSRTCIGMRFGQTEVKAVATLVLQRFRPELTPGRTMTVRQMPTLSPRGGLRMIVRERAASGALQRAS